MDNTNTTATRSSLWRWLLMETGRHFLSWAGHFQARHSLVSTTPVLNNSEFTFVKELENAYPEIRSELELLLEHPEDIPTFHQLSPDQKRISKGNNWKTFAFYVYGQRVDDNCSLCPKTASILDSLPGMQTAMFSILAPHYHIAPHKGPTRAVVRAHLGLKIPKDWQKVWIRVKDQIIHWRSGEVVVFDDTFEHEVHNDTDETRAVLFMDFDRPMDHIGTLFNRMIVYLIRASTYVKLPLKNLYNWNQNLRKG